MRALFLVAVACVAQAAPAQTGGDRQRLAAELRADVEAYRVNLPTTEGPLTITRVDLRGVEVVYTGFVNADLDQAAIAVFRREVGQGLCTATTRDVIRRGGSFTYDLRDLAGERFVTTVATCG